jgi:hypothetical protein
VYAVVRWRMFFGPCFCSATLCLTSVPNLLPACVALCAFNRYRGIELEALLDLKMPDLVKLFPAR